MTLDCTNWIAPQKRHVMGLYHPHSENESHFFCGKIDGNSFLARKRDAFNWKYVTSECNNEKCL